MLIIFNNSIGKGSAFALPEDINLGLCINRYTENMVKLLRYDIINFLKIHCR